jgi:hypothetical protein
MRIANKTLIKQWCRYNLDLVEKVIFILMFYQIDRSIPLGAGVFNF